MINSIILLGLYLKWVKNIGGSYKRFIFSKLVGSSKNNIFELCPKERLDMMREVNKCQNKCNLDSSRGPLVRPIIKIMGRKITKLGSSFEKFSPKASKYLPKNKRESTRFIERRKSTLQPSSSRCSKLRKVIILSFLIFGWTNFIWCLIILPSKMKFV